MRYHLCTIPDDVDLKNAVASAYGDLMHHDDQNKSGVLLENVDPFHLSDEKNGTNDEMSGYTATMEITEDGNENSALDYWHENSIDAPSKRDSDRISAESVPCFLHDIESISALQVSLYDLFS